MAKHKKPNPYVQNNKDANRDNQQDRRDHNRKFNGQEQREKAESLVSVVQDAFTLLGKETRVIEYSVEKWNPEKKQRRTVPGIGVRPVDANGNFTDFGVFGEQSSWAAKYVELKAKIQDRDAAVKHVAENESFRNLIQS